MKISPRMGRKVQIRTLTRLFKDMTKRRKNHMTMTPRRTRRKNPYEDHSENGKASSEKEAHKAVQG
jgi:hypothetical protein